MYAWEMLVSNIATITTSPEPSRMMCSLIKRPNLISR